MQDFDTELPPPPPRSTDAPRVRTGLWLQMSPDRARWGTVLGLDHKVGLTVGRGADASVTIDDTWLSRQHFRVLLQAGATADLGPWVVEDLGTRNGTFVNGHRIQRRVVRHGDVVRAGATVFVLDAGIAADDACSLIGTSAALERVRQQVRTLAPGGRPVHLTGETGVGKEVVARALHERSGRRGAWLGLNMANVVDGLAESQLFGHRKGAFSGALADHAGAFDAAHQGTLLLDEIAELPPGLQAKLLRTVETGEVHRIGDSLPHKVDARLITATHRDLSELSKSGRFRADLYWRIAHSVIEVPALRERKLDVVPLFDHFLGQAGVSRLAALMGEQPASLWSLADLIERLLGYDWPGNVRELREEAFRLADAMRARAGRASGAIPPLEEACSERLLSRVAVAGSEAAAEPIPDPAEAERYARLLTEPTALGQAIAREAAGNVKVFAERAGASLGRHPGTVRRQIYRLLGEQLEQLRQS